MLLVHHESLLDVCLKARSPHQTFSESRNIICLWKIWPSHLADDLYLLPEESNWPIASMKIPSLEHYKYNIPRHIWLIEHVTLYLYMECTCFILRSPLGTIQVIVLCWWGSCCNYAFWRWYGHLSIMLVHAITLMPSVLSNSCTI